MIRASFLIVSQLLCVCSLALAAESPPEATPPDPELTFERHIRPIFRAHCFDCHGATSEMEGELDLRLVRLMVKGGESGPALVPGQADESFLLDRIRSGEMPPGDHRVPENEIAIIARWIAAGAPTARVEPESIGPGLGITPEERNYWAFRPIRRPETSSLADHPGARNGIDMLVAQSLTSGETMTSGESVDVSEPIFTAEADRATLIKRVYFDLIGLPPAPDEMTHWSQDPGADWYDRMINQLLDSPHYGERWARHWLDVAGYADSEGYTLGDTERAWAWKYRDWVIRAFNEDKPFDQFITEQLAGDELAGPQNGDLTAEQIDLLAATGFLRMAADGTGNGANNDEARNQVMADTLKIVGTALMGLSLHCAQCHDHRYDPIPQTDYFALRAVFEPALDWKAWKVPDARRISLYTEADRQQAAEIETEAQQVEAERSERLAEYMKQAIDAELAKYEEPLRTSLRDAYETPADKRSEEHQKLLAANPSVNITPGNLYQYIPESKPKLEEISNRISAVRAKKPPEEFIRALVEPANHVPETKLFHRGDFAQPKQTIGPGGLSVASDDGQAIAFPSNDPELPTTGRRLALARWLTSTDNPLFARVIVNRVWMHHFGKGLVPTPGEFGKLGSPPADLALLDFLADEFRSQGWSLKHLHRLILSSTTWRQSTVPMSGNSYARTLRRLEAETIRDRMLAVTGSLDKTLFGPPVTIKEDETGQVIVADNQPRRSLYIQSRRSRPVALLQTFDAPVMETNCELRANSTVATQSLMLLNGNFVLDQAAKLADRAAQEAQPLSPQQQAAIHPIPTPRLSRWQYGYGQVDQTTGQTQFTPFPHWTGTQWGGGAALPDPALGWAFLNPTGGHPDVSERSVIRRWSADRDGSITVTGNLSHPSDNGDGVRGRLVSSRSGVVAEWIAQHGSAATVVQSLAVHAGETIDFVLDCREDHNSDSFAWPIKLTMQSPEKATVTFSSVDDFAGPPESTESVPGQIIRVWQLAYCRPPSDDELTSAVQFIARQIETLDANPQAVPQGRGVVRQAMTNLCQSLLSSNEFLYVE